MIIQRAFSAYEARLLMVPAVSSGQKNKQQVEDSAKEAIETYAKNTGENRNANGASKPLEITITQGCNQTGTCDGVENPATRIFKDANEFADKTNGKWPEAVERGGFITLYRTATYSKVVANRFNPYQKMQLTSVESVIYNLAHEGAHTRYGPAHDLRLEAISFGAVEQYRELSK